ncbi:Regucalcin [Balamuthia mandrillaris]
MQQAAVEVVVPGGAATLGEGPIYHNRTNQLYWVDILQKRVHAFDPSTGQDRYAEVPYLIGSCAPAAKATCKKENDEEEGERLVAAMENGFSMLDAASGKVLHHIHDPEPHLTGNRFNDGKCDPLGRFMAGTMDKSERCQSGSLYLLRSSSSNSKRSRNEKDDEEDEEGASTWITEGGYVVRKLVNNCATVSNGLVWNLQHDKLFYIDSPTKVVAVFDWDRDSGAISSQRLAFDVSSVAGLPDGMTIDTEGMLWIAHWGGGCVTRWDPEKGALLQRVDLPKVSRITSCIFGGEHMRHLYVTTAAVNTTLEEEPNAGALFRLDVGVGGIEAPEFAAA